MKCKYKLCGESKSLPLIQNIWTFETGGNGPGRGDKHVWDHVVMGKQSQHGSVFFRNFGWVSVFPRILCLCSPPSQGHDMWMLGENDKQNKSACGVQVKVSKLYNNCILRGAISVSRKTQKGPTFRQPSQLPTFLLYRHPVAADGLTTESLVVGKISSWNDFFCGTMIDREGKSREKSRSIAQSSAFVHHLKAWDLIWGPVERASEQMQSLYSWTLDIYLAIVAILWGTHPQNCTIPS